MPNIKTEKKNNNNKKDKAKLAKSLRANLLRRKAKQIKLKEAEK